MDQNNIDLFVLNLETFINQSGYLIAIDNIQNYYITKIGLNNFSQSRRG
jgi:hypothetical protein